MNIIELHNIDKSYGNNRILNQFSLTVQENELLALVGESGKGKSTILNIIGLLETFDSGKMCIDEDINVKPNTTLANKIRRYKLNYLFQNFALVDKETVLYNLKLALKYIKIAKKQKQEMIQNALSAVGLENFNDHYIYELSGGEQQRVAIARAMLKPSKIILADEPTGSLDEKNRSLIFELLKKLNQQGKTVIIVTHDPWIANQCDRVVSL